jgi:hypothetical protein
MGLSTADLKQVLCRVILFKVLSLGLLRSLWFKRVQGCQRNEKHFCYRRTEGQMDGRITRDNRSSLLQKLVSYGRKKFYDINTR